MTVVEVADCLAMSRGSVDNVMRSGVITSVHIGARRIRGAELHRFVRSTLAGWGNPLVADVARVRRPWVVLTLEVTCASLRPTDSAAMQRNGEVEK